MTMQQQEHKPAPAGAIVRQEFGADQIMQQVETAANAVAAAERAAIESRYILAKKFPRDWDTVEQRLLKECDRPGFAESAIYKKPLGMGKNKQTGAWEMQFAEGLSIRFAEAVIRNVSNFYASAKSIYDDAEKLITRVTVMDLETNATIETDVQIAKRLERSKVREGQEELGRRRNSAGQLVYIVAPSDDELLIKTNAQISKALRNGVQRLLPGDISDRCMARCYATMAKGDAADPEAAKKQIFSAFYQWGITPEQLKQHLGITTDSLQPSHLADLRAIYAAIKDGETTWEQVVEARDASPEDKAAQTSKKQVDSILAKQRERQAQKGGAPVPAQPGQAPAGQPASGAQGDAKPAAATQSPAPQTQPKPEPARPETKPAEPAPAAPAQPSERVAPFVEAFSLAETTDDINAIVHDLNQVIGRWSEADKAAVNQAKEAALARLQGTR